MPTIDGDSFTLRCAVKETQGTAIIEGDAVLYGQKLPPDFHKGQPFAPAIEATRTPHPEHLIFPSRLSAIGLAGNTIS
jgi:hypothetical protein